MQSTEEPGEFCLQVDGMPHNKYDELDGKNIKLRNGNMVFSAQFSTFN